MNYFRKHKINEVQMWTSAMIIDRKEFVERLGFSETLRYYLLNRELDSLPSTLVPDGYKIRQAINTASYGFMYVLTMRCNMKCVYCFEDKTLLEMDHKIATKCTEIALRLLREYNQKKVMMNFYGGEPLLRYDLMRAILLTFQKTGNLEITTGVITNGTLLDDEKIHFLAEFDHPWAQITLDGTKAIHDKRRPYHSGKGTFDDVLKALEKALSHFESIGLRINVDKTNEKHVGTLLNFLKDYGLNKPNLYLDFGQVHVTAGPSLEYKGFCINTPQWGKSLLN